MSDKEILTKALEIAVANGYPDWGLPRGFAIYSVIFSHGFAKAFFPKEQCLGALQDGNKENWKYHLQQMVISDNPIKYLEQFLPQNKER